MRKFLNCTNHKLTEAQIADLKENWGVTEIINLPENLKALWSQIDPEATSFDVVLDVVTPVYKFADANDISIAMVMGEMSASYKLINYLKSDGVFIVVATSKRISQEVTQEDGSVRKVNVFKHIMFREVC